MLVGNDTLSQQYSEHVQTTTNSVAEYLHRDGQHPEAPIRLEATIPPPPPNPNLPGDADAGLKGPGNARTNEEIDAILAQQQTRKEFMVESPEVQAIRQQSNEYMQTLGTGEAALQEVGKMGRALAEAIAPGVEVAGRAIGLDEEGAAALSRGMVEFIAGLPGQSESDLMAGMETALAVLPIVGAAYKTGKVAGKQVVPFLAREFEKAAAVLKSERGSVPVGGGTGGKPPVIPPKGGVPAAEEGPNIQQGFKQRRDPRIDTLFEKAASDADGFVQAVETQRRGTLSDQAVLTLSKKSNLTTEAVLGLPPGTSLPVEEFHKVREILKSTHKAMVKSARAARIENTFEAYQAMFDDVGVTRNVLIKIIGLYAEPSRTTRLMHQALPKLGSTPSENLGFNITDPFINHLYEFFARTEEAAKATTPPAPGQLPGGVLKDVTPPQAMKDFADAVAATPSEDELIGFMKPLRNPVFWDVWKEQWYNGMLLGLAPVKNLVGTPAIIASEMIQRGVMAGIDSIGTGTVRLLGDKDFQRSVYFGEVGAMLNPSANLEAFATAARLAWHTFKTGKPEFDISKLEHTIPQVSDTALWLYTTGPMGFATSWMSTSARRWTTQGIDLASTLGGRMLLAGDTANKVGAHQAELRALALRLAYQTVEQEGLTGVEAVQRVQNIRRDVMANPDRYPELVEDAKRFSQYVALQEELGTAANSVGRIADTLTIGPREAGFPSGFPVGRWLMPFTTIMANVSKMAAEYTGPLSLLSPAVRAEINAGGTRRLTQLAKIGFSTVMLDTMYGLAREGLITGNGPRGQDAKQHWIEATGKIPNAWWDPVTKSYRSCTAFEPFCTLTSSVADMVDLMSYTPPDKIDQLNEGFQALALAVVGNVGIKQWTQGLVGTLNTALSGDFESYSDWFNHAFVSATVPYSGALRQITGGLDPQTRLAIDTIDHLKQMTPGLSDTLPAEKNALGRIIYRRGGWWNAFSHGLESEDPAIWQALKAHNIVLTKPAKEIDGVPLSANLYDKYLDAVTDGLPEDLSTWAGDSESLDDTEAERQVQQIVSNHRQSGKDAFLNEYEEIRNKLDMKTERQQEGLPTKPNRFAPGRLSAPSISP